MVSLITLTMVVVVGVDDIDGDNSYDGDIDGEHGGDVVDLSHPPAAKGDEDNNEECQERKSSANL